MIDKQGLVAFVRERGLVVLATCSHAVGSPEAALIGVASTDDADLIFDTSRRSRKYVNLQHSPEVAVVIGWDDEVTVQAEGTAEVLTGTERERCLPYYLAQ